MVEYLPLNLIRVSNYLLKQSNHKKGEWCEVVDGLYWKFMNDNLDFFRSNPRLSIIPRALDKMDNERKKNIFFKADSFMNTFTNEKIRKFVRFVKNLSHGEKNGKN